MNDHIFSLFMEVINAAANGRYCHGNGAQWCIVDVQGNNLCIDTISGKTEFVAPNPVAPHTDMVTARNLEQFLMSEEAVNRSETVQTGYHAVRNAALDILRAAQNNGVYYFNGGQCTIETGWNSVRVYDTSVRGQVTVHTMGKMASWKYITANGGYKQKLNKESLDFFNSLI